MAVLQKMVDTVLVVTIDRPETRNAFDGETISTLRDLFENIAYNEPPPVVGDSQAGDQQDGGVGKQFRPHAILLQSTGKVFCAGADLDEMKRLGEADFQENLDAALEMGAMFRAIRNCPTPVVCRVQGPAFGGGVGLACCCDIVVAGPQARFTLTEVRLGLVAGVIAPLVVGRIGTAAARTAMLTAEPLDAERALQIGLIDRLASAGDLDDLVERTIESLLRAGPAALGLTKGLIEGSLSLGYNRSSEFTAKLIAEARTGVEAQAALKAFFNKEAAPWAQDVQWSNTAGNPVDEEGS